jgi:hypothetical protein
MASGFNRTAKGALVFAQVRCVVQFFGALAALALIFQPAVAWSQIYTWVDEKGGTVYSNIRPADIKKVRNFKVAMEEEKRSRNPPAIAAQRPVQAAVPPDIAAQQAVQAAQADAMRREQELENRVAVLERQLQVQQYQEPIQPAPADYYGYYGSNYSGFGYPLGYGFSYLIPSRVIPSRIMPSRIMPSRIIPSRRIVNSGPVFVTPAPRFGSPGFTSPRFVPLGSGSSRGASFPAAGMGRGRR